MFPFATYCVSLFFNSKNKESKVIIKSQFVLKCDENWFKMEKYRRDLAEMRSGRVFTPEPKNSNIYAYEKNSDFIHMHKRFSLCDFS